MERLARFAAELFHPAPMVALLVVGTALGPGGDQIAAMRAAAVALVGAVALPSLFVLVGVRRSRYGSHHIVDRRQRLVPFVVWSAATLLVRGLLRSTGAPATLTAALLAVAVTLVAAAAANLRWKMSLHAAMAACVVGSLALLVHASAATLLPLPVLVAWSRVRLGAHTTGQVAAGLAIGAAGSVAAALVG